MKNLKKKLSVIVMLFALTVLLVPTTGKVSAASKTSNKTFTAGKLCYQVPGNSTCTVTGLKSSYNNTTSCTIPSTVTCNGKTYKVTAVADKAFYNNDSLKSVKVSKNVKCVGNQAFAGCDNLKKITCAKAIKKLGNNCFGNAVCKVTK